MRSSVVLPQPEGPSSAKNSLSWMSRVRPSTAVKLPKRLVTFSKETSAAMAAGLSIFVAGGELAAGNSALVLRSPPDPLGQEGVSKDGRGPRAFGHASRRPPTLRAGRLLSMRP